MVGILLYVMNTLLISSEVSAFLMTYDHWRSTRTKEFQSLENKIKFIYFKNNDGDASVNVQWNNNTDDSDKAEPNNDGVDNNIIPHIEIETPRINTILKGNALVLIGKFPDIITPSYTTAETQYVALESEYHLITILVLQVIVEYSWNFLVILENDILKNTKGRQETVYINPKFQESYI